MRLMCKTFQPHRNGKDGGPLAAAGTESGEQEAASALFADALASARTTPRQPPHR
ncbi:MULTISPECIES: hypothetical protein [unclassified Streptomyces]|uniref:hypothetical protein n=1 Tax=unclassified Streptomyces TaxID=2593676 RepID=UPI003814A342